MATFREDRDYSRFLQLLFDAAKQENVDIHSYVLMTNHVHLLVTPHDRDAVSLVMQRVGRIYVSEFNSRYRRSGTLWEGRFKACNVASDQYALACSRYIEMNPVRAQMVEYPAAYRWSSFRHNAGFESTAPLSFHPAYEGLGRSPAERAGAYRRLFVDKQGTQMVPEIRACLQTGTPFGNDRFRDEIEAALGAKVGQSRRGRPARAH
jgi:putative transposase